MRLPCLLLAVFLLTGCSASSDSETQPPRPATPAAAEGALFQWLQQSPATETEDTGFRLLASGEEAFQWRVKAARAAHQRLFVQYYIWQDDDAGRALVAELLAAAERGVEVLILIDDMDVRGNDQTLAILDSHPEVSVRLFNPFRTRWGLLRAGVEFLFRGSELNHRMHNKAWVADGHVAILGGRNIGNEYFDAGDLYNFSDLDIAMAGPLALAADHAFIRYWNSPRSVPVNEMHRIDEQRRDRHAETFQQFIKQYRGWTPHEQLDVPTEHEASAHLLAEQDYIWSDEAELVVDDPAKAEGETDLEPGVMEALIQRYHGLEHRLALVSPYFVPGADGTAMLTDLVQRDVSVSVLTNSLAANDVAIAHSGYARRRQALLEGGVNLYELRPTAWSRAQQEESGMGLGSSRASLHSKALILDDDEVFVGSFNLDPRSANINTELGVFVRHPHLVEQMNSFHEWAVSPELSYQLSLNEDGRILWEDDAGTTYSRDPKARFWQRFAAGVARLLPIESQL